MVLVSIRHNKNRQIAAARAHLCRRVRYRHGGGEQRWEASLTGAHSGYCNRLCALLRRLLEYPSYQQQLLVHGLQQLAAHQLGALLTHLSILLERMRVIEAIATRVANPRSVDRAKRRRGHHVARTQPRHVIARRIRKLVALREPIQQVGAALLVNRFHCSPPWAAHAFVAGYNEKVHLHGQLGDVALNHAKLPAQRRPLRRELFEVGQAARQRKLLGDGSNRRARISGRARRENGVDPRDGVADEVVRFACANNALAQLRQDLQLGARIYVWANAVESGIGRRDKWKGNAPVEPSAVVEGEMARRKFIPDVGGLRVRRKRRAC